jgi:hypothetical protein
MRSPSTTRWLSARRFLTNRYKKQVKHEALAAARLILRCNILHGDALKMKTPLALLLKVGYPEHRAAERDAVGTLEIVC